MTPSTVKPLQVLFRKSLDTGELPEAWKTANVTPIFKKGTKGDPANYRPVSLTSVPCKLLESVVKDKIMAHLIENDLIRDSQHGFMPGKSCSSNLVLFMDKITKEVDDGKSVDIFYLDFAKAFDKVPRQRLLRKLKAKGIDESILVWIESWLTGRTQKVSIQGEKSGSCSVESGVPQGTVLAPTLFTVFIDDLETEPERRQLDVLIVKFADDTKGAKVIQSLADRDKLQEALDCLCDWADTWGMTFNVAKCKVMHVGKNNPCYEYYMRGVKLNVTEEERDIGVVFTKNLKPAVQCGKAAGRATSVLHQLKNIFHYRDRFTFVQLYKQYVRPHLEFSTPAWSPWNQGDKDVLEKVQEKAIRMVAGLKGTTYEDKCRELGLESLEVRRDRQDVALAYNILEKDSQKLFTVIQTGDNRVRTRHTGRERGLAVQYARTDIRKYSYTVRAAEAWNRLPDAVRQAPSREAFKSRLKGQK